MAIRGLIFDLDDTLLETDGSARAALDATCRWLEARAGVPLPAAADTYTRLYGALEQDLVTGRRHLPSGRVLRLLSWRQTLQALNQPGEWAEELVARYAAERQRRYRLFTEVPQVLEALTARWPGVILTNGFADVQREKLAAVRLERWLPQALVSAEIAAWKPQPRAFWAALETLGCKPEETVMIGDSFRHDIAGAAALGIRTVWVNRYGAACVPGDLRADAEVTDLSPMPRLLERWLNR